MISVMRMTDWCTNWRKEGGRFKEWVRHMELDAINHGWVHSIAYEPRHWWRRICHVASWLPFLWDDYDWDHVHLWKIMREKLKRMRLNHEEEKLIVDWKRVASEIRFAETLLTRLIEDQYIDAEWKKHLKRFPDRQCRKEKKPDGSVVHHPHPNPRCGPSVRRLGKLEWERKRADAQDLGRHFAVHWWGWWS